MIASEPPCSKENLNCYRWCFESLPGWFAGVVFFFSLVQNSLFGVEDRDRAGPREKRLSLRPKIGKKGEAPDPMSEQFLS